MTTKPSPAPRHAAPAPPEPDSCNVPDCPAAPTDCGLCRPHYDTHRGFAVPAEEGPDV